MHIIEVRTTLCSSVVVRLMGGGGTQNGFGAVNERNEWRTSNEHCESAPTIEAIYLLNPDSIVPTIGGSSEQ